MPQYIVMMLGPGVPVPPEGQTAALTFVLTTQADAAAARTAAAPVLKPPAGTQMWVTDTANLGSPVTANVTYGFS